MARNFSAQVKGARENEIFEETDANNIYTALAKYQLKPDKIILNSLRKEIEPSS
ncbi:MAG: hypothetical protein HUJ51_01920 [Eggerthellaceae bacterium]|nr:hypothetical protein [Eggerthellaceae bacterium]